MLTAKTDKLSFGSVTVEPYDDDESCTSLAFDIHRGIHIRIPCIHSYSLSQLQRFFGAHSRDNGVMNFVKVFSEPPDQDDDPIYMYIEAFTIDEKPYINIKSSDETLEVMIPVKREDLAKLEKILKPDA